MSADGDIDPRKMTADAPVKRRRKRRNKPNPPATVKAAEADTVARLRELPISPGVMAEPVSEGWIASSPHNDDDLWTAQMAAAFGTRSIALVHTFADQLKALCPQDYDFELQRWKTNEAEWNALLALVADTQPENSTQAALAAQMASVHLMQMRLSKDALCGGMVIEKSAALAAKLARTYAIQCETMMLLKGKKVSSRQTIKVVKEVHQYVQYNDNRAGGAKESDAQPQEPRAATIEGCTALPSPRQVDGQVVPVPRDEGQEGLPQARRGQSRRSQGGR
jgi:hypothetical protein